MGQGWPMSELLPNLERLEIINTEAPVIFVDEDISAFAA
jgi:hypothetical protein